MSRSPRCGRTPQRKEWIGAYGGTAESEAAVRRGLDWLARHQAEDGHWGPDALRARPAGRCKPGDVCSDGGGEHRVALTGLAVLAFQAGGHYDFNASEYSGCVRQALDWLLAHQRPDGAFFDAEHNQGFCNMYEHGIAAFALADACEMAVSAGRAPEDRYCQAAQKAVQFIHYAQHNDGGWRYTDERTPPSDVSVSGWQVLAMNAAREAKIAAIDDGLPGADAGILQPLRRPLVGPHVLSAALQFTQRCANRDRDVGQPVPAAPARRPAGRRGGELPGGRGRIVVQPRPQAEEKQAAARGTRRATITRFYNGTLAMFQAGGQPWKRWNDVIRDMVIERQCDAGEGCRRGSWDPMDNNWDHQGGRVYSTALAVLTLEVYYRYTSERAKVYPEK